MRARGASDRGHARLRRVPLGARRARGDGAHDQRVAVDQRRTIRDCWSDHHRGQRVPLQHGAHPRRHARRRRARTSCPKGTIARALAAKERARRRADRARRTGSRSSTSTSTLPGRRGDAMAAVRQPQRDRRSRAAKPDEGRAIAGLWRELWDAHEAWGGYAGTRDPRVYEQLAQRALGGRTRARRAARPRSPHAPRRGQRTAASSGRSRDGSSVTASTRRRRSRARCARSSWSSQARDARRRARAARSARAASRGSSAAARRWCSRPRCSSRIPRTRSTRSVGYTPVSWTARIATDGARGRAAVTIAYVARVGDAERRASRSRCSIRRSRRAVARRATSASIARAPSTQRSSARSPRTSRGPSAIDRASSSPSIDGGMVRASASLTVMSLDPPFLPARRGLLGRFAVDPALDPRPLVAALVRLGRRLALRPRRRDAGAHGSRSAGQRAPRRRASRVGARAVVAHRRTLRLNRACRGSAVSAFRDGSVMPVFARRRRGSLSLASHASRHCQLRSRRSALAPSALAQADAR